MYICLDEQRLFLPSYNYTLVREKQAFIAKAMENGLSRCPSSFDRLAITMVWIFHMRSAQTTQ